MFHPFSAPGLHHDSQPTVTAGGGDATKPTHWVHVEQPTKMHAGRSVVVQGATHHSWHVGLGGGGGEVREKPPHCGHS